MPLAFSVCRLGLAESVTVIALVLAPTALGVKVTVMVHFACAPRLPLHGVAPPGAAANSPLPEMVVVSEVARLLVRVTVCVALAVATVCAAKVSEVGENEIGSAAVPFTSTIWVPMTALSVTVTAPLMIPLDPSAGENVTAMVQPVPAGRTSPGEHGADPPLAAAKNPVPENAEIVTLLVLEFFAVTLLEALIVPTA